MTDDVIHVLGPLLADRTPGRIVRSARVPRDAGRDLGEKCGLNFQANSTASPARISSRYSRDSSDFPLPIHATLRRLHSQPYLSNATPFRLARRTMVRWRAGARRASIASCKTKPGRPRQPRHSGAPRSQRLPPTLREAVDAAIADGATIDEITARIRADGGACSRSAVGRYTKNVRDLIRPAAGGRPRQRDVGARARRAHARPGGAHPDRDPADADALHPGRSQPARGARVDGRAHPPGAGSQAHRRHRQAPPRAGAGGGEAAARAAPGAGQAPVRKGLSPEAVAAIREVVEGRPRRPERAVTSAPVDPWNPAESHLSQLISLNPGESRPENVSGVSSSISLNGGRELRSLAYAPYGAARSRALRTCGPAQPHGEHLVSRRGRAKGRRRRPQPASPSPPLGAERAGERRGKSSSNDSDAELLRSRPTSPCPPPP